jgi:hypothetical protein
MTKPKGTRHRSPATCCKISVPERWTIPHTSWIRHTTHVPTSWRNICQGTVQPAMKASNTLPSRDGRNKEITIYAPGKDKLFASCNHSRDSHGYYAENSELVTPSWCTANWFC